MKKSVALHERERRMLELLARGSSGAEIAEDMGYSFGSIRVYLSHLYKKIGVRDKAGAVVWYHDRLALEQSTPPSAATSSRWPQREESVGDLAIRTSLFSAMGAMSMFVGPYARDWEVAQRQKVGDTLPPAVDARRGRSRAIWEAFLSGDGKHARNYRTKPAQNELLSKSPFDAVMLALLFILDGDGAKAEAITGSLSDRRRARHTVSQSELDLVAAFRSAMIDREEEALNQIHHILTKSRAQPAVRHAAIAALFQALLAHRHTEKARDAAAALWAAAETARQELESMGEYPFRTGAKDLEGELVLPAAAGSRKTPAIA